MSWTALILIYLSVGTVLGCGSLAFAHWLGWETDEDRRWVIAMVIFLTLAWPLLMIGAIL